MNLFFKLS